VVTLIDRLPICGVLLSLLVVGNLHATEWQKVSRSINLSIYIRLRSGSPIEEVRGIGEFNAPIVVLKGVLADVAKYSEFIPLALAPSVRVPTGPSQTKANYHTNPGFRESARVNPAYGPNGAE
jgi:hypothetical protein